MQHYKSAKVPVSQWGLTEFPKSIGYIWEWYRKLTRTRQSGMAMNPITYSEIKAFCYLYHVRMTPQEVEVIMQLDEVSIQQYSEKGK